MFGERLEKLLELILKTTTYKDDNANLFHTHQILTENWLDRLNSGWMDLASERVEMMKQANNIWAVRKKIESGEVQEDENGLLEMEIKNFINNNEKINAIKHYRKSMREVYGKEVSLKEAKEYVDDEEGSTEDTADYYDSKGKLMTVRKKRNILGFMKDLFKEKSKKKRASFEADPDGHSYYFSTYRKSTFDPDHWKLSLPR